MAINQLFIFVVLCLVALTTAIASPHEGFVDTPTLRDVGILYSEENFKGENTFVYEIKTTPECLPLYIDLFHMQREPTLTATSQRHEDRIGHHLQG